jgi:hypothetical protein
MSLTRLNIAFISPDTSGFNSVLRYSTAESKFIWDNSEFSFTANYQGSVSGYTSGGGNLDSSFLNVIDKFPFAADGNASDVGDLSQVRTQVAGQSSLVSGYTSGGVTFPATPTRVNTIDKFPFASNANATDVGDLTAVRRFSTGQSSSESGYTSGGGNDGGYLNIIDKFPFATNANATDVGDLTLIRARPAGQNSGTSGYSSGGTGAPPTLTIVNTIDKFPFATNANASDVGDLTQVKTGATGTSSAVRGYTAGGSSSVPTIVNTIDRFPFAADANATDVGDLTIVTLSPAGQQSTASGYVSGGILTQTPSFTYTNVINKFPLAADGNASDVGDLTVARGYSAGQQD